MKKVEENIKYDEKRNSNLKRHRVELLELHDLK